MFFVCKSIIYFIVYSKGKFCPRHGKQVTWSLSEKSFSLKPMSNEARIGVNASLLRGDLCHEYKQLFDEFTASIEHNNNNNNNNNNFNYIYGRSALLEEFKKWRPASYSTWSSAKKQRLLGPPVIYKEYWKWFRLRFVAVMSEQKNLMVVSR